MKFGHLVKHDGVYYPAGTEVPITEAEYYGRVTPPVVDVSGKDTDEKEVKTTMKYSESNLPTNYMKIKQLAKSEGMNVGKNTSKEELIKFLLSIEG